MWYFPRLQSEKINIFVFRTTNNNPLFFGILAIQKKNDYIFTSNNWIILTSPKDGRRQYFEFSYPCAVSLSKGYSLRGFEIYSEFSTLSHKRTLPSKVDASINFPFGENWALDLWYENVPSSELYKQNIKKWTYTGGLLVACILFSSERFFVSQTRINPS